MRSVDAHRLLSGNSPTSAPRSLSRAPITGKVGALILADFGPAGHAYRHARMKTGPLRRIPGFPVQTAVIPAWHRSL